VGISYKSSGVNLEAAEASTKKISVLAKKTFNKHVLNDIGLFAGFYEIDINKYPQPVVVTSIDGVGTKLKIAFAMGIHNTVGQDLVNHCVNDIMTSGADPVAFTDYIGALQLEPDHVAQIVEGMAIACEQNETALIGGESAEMPGFYSEGEYDLAGSIIGLLNRNDMIDGKKVSAGDVLIGLSSNGLHTNGYSLARKVILEKMKIDLKEMDPKLGAPWGEVLLKVHKSYKNVIQHVRSIDGVNGISHITGGGIEGNTKRLLGYGLTLSIDWASWDMPIEFKLIQKYGDIAIEEMRRAFNIGIGLIFVVSEEKSDFIFNKIKEIDSSAKIIGQVV
jgi:phosphoribosylformylglycinamidine cyclo-ligase